MSEKSTRCSHKGCDYSVELVRPLLKVCRAAVVEFLRTAGITARHDSSNDDRTLTRNRLRHELLPSLQREWNSDMVGVLCRLADQAAEFHELIEKEARELLLKTEKPLAGSVIVLDAKSLQSAQRHLVREVFHLIWEREGWPMDAMSYEHWDRLARLVFDGDTAHDLPGPVHARRSAKAVQLRPKPPLTRVTP